MWKCRPGIGINDLDQYGDHHYNQRSHGRRHDRSRVRISALSHPVLLTINARGLYCEAGDFYVDPWEPVDRALITHAHGDHARWGSRQYLAAREGERILRTRLGATASIESVEYGETREIDGVRVSFHPAGHILGSAQIRLEHRGEVWVVSGDYKTDPDPTCAPFEPVRCDTFVTESTFGLPIYRWCPQREVFDEILAWWSANAAAGRASVLFGWALGKAQRILAGLLDAEVGPIYTHGAVERLVRDYRESGIALAPTIHATSMPARHSFAGSLVVAPPYASLRLGQHRLRVRVDAGARHAAPPRRRSRIRSLRSRGLALAAPDDRCDRGRARLGDPRLP
jgi:putative mRNA 3-end processing factor